MIIKEKQFDYYLASEIIAAKKICRTEPVPKSVLIVGQPGSGKTRLAYHIIEKNMNNNAVFINGDNYRRLHPDYEELKDQNDFDLLIDRTSAFSGRFVEAMIAKCSAEKLNLIIEGTGRTFDVPYNTARFLKKKNYKVELCIIAVNPLISKTSALIRSYDMAKSGTLPRKTMLETHDRIVAKLPVNLNRIYVSGVFDRIRIMNREYRDIYLDLNDESYPGEELKRYWNQPISVQELENLRMTIRTLYRLEEEYSLNQTELIQSLEIDINDIYKKTVTIEKER